MCRCTVSPFESDRLSGTARSQMASKSPDVMSSLVPVGVSMQVSPPKTWGKITGRVTGAAGAPIGGATVAICTRYDPKTGACGPETFTLKTDGRGDFQLWLNHGFSPLQVIAAKDGYTACARETCGV
jgi:hypothetical protein